jgi:acyl-CoA reductase-like NAD-dependent aldehyde dehydrogenase
VIRSVDPRTGEAGRAYAEATREDVLRAVSAAARAFRGGELAGAPARARALRAAAAALRGDAGELVLLCNGETGLGRARLGSELERAARQLEAFAALAEEGSYVEAIVDLPDPEAVPPRPDLRRMLVPIGPVAVFGASNFPLAFGIAGGDTAAAIAAGCPVVAKGHPSHPGTSERVAAAVTAGLDAAGLPREAFVLLQVAELAIAEALVEAPEVEAVAFTGSRAGGRAIFDRAARRPRPIPVFAEMGSVNPVVVTAGALAERGEEVAAGLVASVTGSAGQLCTKPGVVLVPGGEAGERFAAEVARRLDGLEPGVLLNERLRATLRERVGALEEHPETARLTAARDAGDEGFRHPPEAWRTPARALAESSELLEERFGPVVLLATYESREELRAAIEALEGQLTGSIHAGAGEDELVRELAAALGARVGRLVFGGFPTGVAVAWAQHHGGPYPATTAPGHTSVGMTSIRRFLRPVAWQDAPASVLPPALRDENPLGIWRRVGGEPTRAPVGRPGAGA